MLDTFIFYQLNGLALKWLWFDCVVIFFAIYMPYILAGVLFLLVLNNFKKNIKPVSGAAISAVLGGLLVLLFNIVFYRPRPFVVFSNTLLTKHIINSAFPSFHTTILFAASFFLFLYGRRLKPSPSKFWQNLGCIFLGISFLVSLARVISGLHWLSDILAGILLGGLCAWLIYRIFSHKQKS